MNLPTAPGTAGTSTRPYLIRALHDWCTDNGFTPYVAVFVDGTVRVPMEYVKNNEIVLNVGFEATSGLKLGNDYIEFKARFGGTSRDIMVPIDHVIAIYARENGQGMAFPVPTPPTSGESGDAVTSTVEADGASPSRGPRLALAGVPSSPSPSSSLSQASETSQDAAGPSNEAVDDVEPDDAPEPPEPPAGGSRPALKRVK